MRTIIEDLKNGKILISDGAWGTFLQRKGLKAGECPELWNVERPDDVFEIAKSYIDAGANMIETNSFGGSVFKLAHFGLSDSAYELNKAAAEISRKAAGPDNHVLGSIGPTGKILMMGDVTYEELYESFKLQAMALEAGGANALVIETMTDLEEATCAVKACRDNTSCEIICTMTFEKSGENEFHTMMGVTPAQMTAELLNSGVDIIGSNCGNGIKDMIGVIAEIRKVNKNIPVLVHANAGAPVYKDGETQFLETPDIWSAYVQDLINAGVNILGGCCGTTPDHIRKITGIVQK